MKNTEYQKAIEREVEEWPGVEVSFVEGGKHPKAKFTFDGKMLAHPFAGTPGDSGFGIHQMLGDMRRVMKKLGAARAKPEPTKDEDEAPYRKPNDGRASREGPAHEKVPPKPDVADQLVKAGVVSEDQAKAARVSGKKADIVIADDVEDSAAAAAKIKKAFEERVASIIDGIYFGLPADVYHAVPRLSSSGIQKMCVSPATFWRGSWFDPDRPEPDAEEKTWQIIGRAYHTARLEPHLFELLYVRKLDKADALPNTLFTGAEMGAKLEEYGAKKSGSVAEQADRLAEVGHPVNLIWPLVLREWEEGRNGRTPLDGKHYDQMITDRDRISQNSEIAPLLTGGEAEVSIFWTDEHGVQMKCRVDYLARDWWVDFKTFDNSRGKNLNQALVDAVRYNRYYIQAPVYREGLERIRVHGLQIVEAQTDDQKTLIAHIQMKPEELRCWYVFQEKGGIPNLIAREFPFYDVPFSTIFNAPLSKTPEHQQRVVDATKHRTQLFIKGAAETLEAKKNFELYRTVYQPGEPWFPLQGAVGAFHDDDFHPYWLSGDLR
jgi:hypothetical protein